MSAPDYSALRIALLMGVQALRDRAQANTAAVLEHDARLLIAQHKELLEALAGIVEIGKRDLTNPKYDAYFEAARVVLAKVAPVEPDPAFGPDFARGENGEIA